MISLSRIMAISVMASMLFIMNALALFRFLSFEMTLILSGIVTLLFPLGFFLEHRFATKFTSVIYRVGIAWFESIWILLLLVFASWIVELLGFSFSKLNILVILLWLVLTFLGLLYAQTWKTTELTIYSDRIKKAVTLVQLTDIHAFGAYAKKWIADTIARAEELNPDVILLTGDIIDQPSIPSKDALAIKSSVPLLYSLGNHEFYVGDKIAQNRVAAGDLDLLRDASRMVAGINFIGIDDSSHKDFLKNRLSPLVKKGKYNVLLFHRPRGMHYAADAGVDLMLSGHTHGGVNFPMHIFVSMVYGKYYRGLHHIKNLILYTSNGAGTRNWPLRLFNPQEIVKIRIVPEN